MNYIFLLLSALLLGLNVGVGVISMMSSNSIAALNFGVAAFMLPIAISHAVDVAKGH